MIVLTFDKILDALASTAVLGFFGGVIYSVIEMLFLYSDKSCSISIKGANAGRGVIRQIWDLAFFTLLGVSFILICYAFCDGIVSLYPALSLVLIFSVVRKVMIKIVKTSIAFGKKHKKQ